MKDNPDDTERLDENTLLWTPGRRMGTTGFTPGPWQHVSVDGGWDGVADSGGALLCKLVANAPPNAALMAAAPALYDALERLVGLEDDNLRINAHARRMARIHARAALGLARGEPQT